MAVTANSSNNIAQLDQVLDRNASPGRKWFSLQDNKLDGTYHPVDVGPYNVALGKSAADPKITDGDINTANWVTVSSPTVVDLGAIYCADSIDIWHYYGDARTYHNTKTEVSQDGVNWVKVFDSAISGEYVESSAGHHIVTAGMSYRYVRDYLNGSTANAFNHWVEIKVNGRNEVGWWGNTLSAADGTFGTAQVLTATYDVPNSFNALGIVGDSQLNDFPVDFSVVLREQYPINRSMRLGMTGWLDDYVVGNTLDIGYDLGPNGENCLRITSPNGGTTSASGGSVSADLIPCTPGDVVHGIASIQGKYNFGLDFYDAAGVRLNGGTYSWFAAGTAAAWTTISGNVTIPAGAVYFKVWLYAFSMTGITLYTNVSIQYNGTYVYKDIHTETITGNASVTWSKALDKTYDADQMAISVTKINKGSRTVKILEASDPWQLTRIDSGTMATADRHSLVALSLHSQDAGTLSIADKHNAVTVRNTRADAGTLSVVNSSFFTHLEKWTDDVLTLTQAETKSVKATLNRTDSGTLSDSESKTLTVRTTRSDAGTLSDSESKTVKVSSTRADALTVTQVEDSSAPTVRFIRPDALTLTQLETKAVRNSFARTDAGTLSEVEVHATTAKPAMRTDAGTLSVVENKTITNKNTRTDTLTVTQVEQSPPVKVSFVRPDSLKLTQVEAKTPPKVSFTRPDLLKLTQAETKKVTAKLYRTDTPKIKQAIEADNVTADFDSGDNLVVTSSDVSTMTNIHTIMDGDYRQIFGKVEISYTDPLIDGDVILTASSTTPGTSPSETADTKDTADYKWFSLQENSLDGSYHPVDSDLSNGSVGWWGTVLSDPSGILPQAEWIQADFSPRGIYDLKVIGDDKLNEFPVDFDVTVSDVDGVTLLSRQIRGNTSISWTETLTTALVDATRIKLTVYKINKAYRTVKILEFFASLVETYLADDIISINLLEEQNFTDMTLPIGNSSSNELEVRLYNLDRKFDADNDDSPLYGWLKKNRRVKAWLGAEVVPGVVEWYQLGVFWSQEWTAPDGDVYADVVAYDRLESIRVTNFTISQVYTDSNLYDMATIILRDAGLHGEEFIVDDRLKDMTVPYMWFPRISHRDAIVQIAEAALGRVYCDRQGRIVVTPFIITDYPIYDFGYDTSIVDLNRPVALGQITNDVEVTAQPRVLQDMGQVYTSSDAVILDPNEVYTETINFSDLPVINVQAPVLTADAGVVITAYNIYAWGMDITYTNNNATAATISQVTVDGQVLKVIGQRTAVASDAKSIQDNGTQSFTLQNDFIQSYQMAQQIAQSLLATYSKLRHDANIVSRGNIALQLGDRITVPNKKGKKIEHVITRQALNWEGSLDATVDAQLLVVGG